MAYEHGHWHELECPKTPDLGLSLICHKPVCGIGFGFPSVVLGAPSMWASRVWLKVTEVRESFPWEGAQVVKRIPRYLLGQDLRLQERVNGGQAAVLIA